MSDEQTEVTQAEAPETPETPAHDPAIEAQAREWGWKSKDEWKGEVPAGYIDDPKRFIDRFDHLPPVRKLQEKLAEIEASAKRSEQAQFRAMERERAQHAEEMARIKVEKAKAFDAGDKDAFDALERRQEELRAAPPAPAPDQGMAEIERWAVDKPWFGTKATAFDPIMTQAAAAAWSDAAAKGMTDPKAILAHVDKVMMEYFPAKLGKAPAPAKTSAVETGLTFGSPAGDGGWSKLPQRAKDAFSRFVTQGLFTDDKAGREAYLKDYNA